MASKDGKLSISRAWIAAASSLSVRYRLYYTNSAPVKNKTTIPKAMVSPRLIRVRSAFPGTRASLVSYSRFAHRAQMSHNF